MIEKFEYLREDVLHLRMLRICIDSQYEVIIYFSYLLESGLKGAKFKQYAGIFNTNQEKIPERLHQHAGIHEAESRAEMNQAADRQPTEMINKILQCGLTTDKMSILLCLLFCFKNISQGV